MMKRTDIFVYTQTQLSIATTEPDLQLETLAGSATPVVPLASIELAPGAYKVTSENGVLVSSSGDGHVEIVTSNDKDVPPEPRPQLKALPVYATLTDFDTEFTEFYVNARGLAL